MKSNQHLRATARGIFNAAVAAVDPTRLVARCLRREGETVHLEVDGRELTRWTGPTAVIGAGKAAARMAAGCELTLGTAGLRGRVVTADGCAVPLQVIATEEAGHPLPDRRGLAATRRIIDCLSAASNGAVLCLVSGGASSLLVSPRPPLTLDDKIATTRALLECGANIGEVSAVRKHLSAVKGGGLLRQTVLPVAAVLLSDVPGDDPSTIGSGPAAPDRTTFAEALAILNRYGVVDRVPLAVADLLRRGVAGQAEESLKPDDAAAARAVNTVIGSNRTALDGALRAARADGWDADVDPEVMVGDTTAAAEVFGDRILERLGRPRARPLCLLAGGETTVRVRGTGRGGRNQEFALALIETLAGRPVTVLSAGTDGIDGPTPVAGAYVDGASLERARARGLEPTTALANNDSHTFFAALDDLLITGPTGTNVMDIKIALLPAGPACLECPSPPRFQV